MSFLNTFLKTDTYPLRRWIVKRNKEGLIEMLELDTTKNREKEYLHVKLNVNNLRIEV